MEEMRWRGWWKERYRRDGAGNGYDASGAVVEERPRARRGDAGWSPIARMGDFGWNG